MKHYARNKMTGAPLFALNDIYVYVPETGMTVEEAVGQGLEAGVDFAGTAQGYAGKGFRYVPVERRLGFEEMARRVIEPAVRQAAERSLTITAVLLASVTNEPNVHREAVQRIVRELGLARAMVIQLGEYGCSTVHLALRLAERFYSGRLRDDEAVLFVTADKAGKPSERVNRYMVFGDGACCALFTPSQGPGGHATYGVEIRADGIVYDASSRQSQQYFSTSYLGVRYVVRRFPLDWEQIRAVYCTNLGVEQWAAIALAIGCEPGKIYSGTLQDAGHIHNVDVLHSVARSVRDGLLQPGDYYVTLSIGFGGYYGCALHRFVPLGSKGAR
jgi:3-oxoacyl-[acyl-carrier-protein] synthase III